MAFLHHHPRRSARTQLTSSTSDASLSHSTQTNRATDASSHLDTEGTGTSRDWSIVFPGRAKVERSATPPSLAGTSSPFILPNEEVDASNVELALPNEQDGTGRFTRPSSPFYIADDEGEDVGEEKQQKRHERSAVITPRSRVSPTIDSISEDDSELDELEVSSSVFFSESDTGRRNSVVSRGQRRLSEWEKGVDGSSSWSWMEGESSARSQSHRDAKTGRIHSTLPVVFTSGSEGEEEDDVLREEEQAFEDAFANTHSAQSAGLSARVPKRRHRKNGESAKGSKRSNSSAVVASEFKMKQRRPGFKTRRSITSSLAGREATRTRELAQQAKAAESTSYPRKHSRTQKMLDVVLRKLFGVEDDEVLQAFLRDEGPLKVEEPSQTGRAVHASAASLGVGTKDDVWNRNERNRSLRHSHSVAEEEQVEVDVGEGHSSPLEVVRLPPRGMDSSQLLGSPPVRVRLSSHVGEPSLLEALQATILSNMAMVPSGLSVLLAGSRSVRLAHHLASQIGPLLTDRVRKLIDDAEDDTSIPDDIIGSETLAQSGFRFRGSSHPAISSSSSTTFTSRAGAVGDHSHSTVS